MTTLELMEACQDCHKISNVIFFPIVVAITSKRWRELEAFLEFNFSQESTQQIILLNSKMLDKKNIIPSLNCMSA